MRRAPSRSAPLPLPRLALLAAWIALVVVAAPARAGLGDMMKKAKDKATKTAEQKVTGDAPATPCPQPEFDDVTLPLTDERLDHILAAFKAAGDAGAVRPGLVGSLNQANHDRDVLIEKQGEAIRADQAKRSDVETCCRDGYEQARQRRAEEFKTRAMSDPALMAKYARVAQENNAAIAKGDSAAAQRANQAVLAEVMPTREDTLQVKKECGSPPPKSAAEQQLEALEARVRALNDSIAKVDDRVAKLQASHSGMDSQQWFIALERIQMYLSWKRANPSGKGTPCGYTADEIQAMEKRLEALRAALGA